MMMMMIGEIVVADANADADADEMIGGRRADVLSAAHSARRRRCGGGGGGGGVVHAGVEGVFMDVGSRRGVGKWGGHVEIRCFGVILVQRLSSGLMSFELRLADEQDADARGAA